MKDLDDILSMESASSLIPWSKNMFIEEILNSTSHCFTLKLKETAEDRAVGYLCFRNLDGESELLNLCVHPRYRQMGFGKRLMTFYVDYCTRMGVNTFYLEVSVSNGPAVRLYQLFSYHPVGTRKKFYQGKFDALLMMRESRQ